MTNMRALRVSSVGQTGQKSSWFNEMITVPPS